jgi:hypothetical protein
VIGAAGTVDVVLSEIVVLSEVVVVELVVAAVLVVVLDAVVVVLEKGTVVVTREIAGDAPTAIEEGKDVGTVEVVS